MHMHLYIPHAELGIMVQAEVGKISCMHGIKLSLSLHQVKKPKDTAHSCQHCAFHIVIRMRMCDLIERVARASKKSSFKVCGH